MKCVEVCSRLQERLDGVEVVTEDGAAEKSGVDRVVERLQGNDEVEEDLPKAIGPEISAFWGDLIGFC